MEILITLLVGLACFIAGFLVRGFIFKKRAAGSLQIAQSDDDGGPYLFLELEDSVSEVSKLDMVELTVKNVRSHD